MFALEKYKIPITAEMPHVKDVSTYTFFQNPRTEKGDDTSWDLHSAGRDRKLHSKDLFVKQHVDPLYIRTVQVLQFSRTSSSRKSSKKALRKSSTMSGLRRAGQPSNKEGWYEEASKVTQDDKQFILRLLSTAMDKNPDHKYQGLHTF